jgi:RNA-directed DNA polymerase
MSVERARPTNPSPWPKDEGCQPPLSNSHQAVERGGVSVDGMSGKDAGVNQESSHRVAERQPAAQALGEAERSVGAVGVSRSSVEPQEKRTCGEPRGGTYVDALPSDEGQGDGWDKLLTEWNRIVTPEKVRKLQRTLYRKAKAEPKYRFYSLYGEVCRWDLLDHALRLVSRNGGAAGVDGVELDEVNREERRAEWLKELVTELNSRRYRPSPVRRVYIPKGDGKFRPLGIPTVKDRVVQAAAVLVLLPIFEADMHEHSYAYRPGRNAHQAIKVIVRALSGRRTEVIDADLSGYFDSIPHPALMKLVARRVSDGTMLKLIRAWLRAPIREDDPGGGGSPCQRRNERGTPQGGVISPLLANLYLDRLDHEVNERCERRPVMVRYADDFVILCRQGEGPELMRRLKQWLEHRGLSLNETKTRLVDIRREGIKFLGFSLSQRRGFSRRHYIHVEPHAKSRQKLRQTVKARLNHWTQGQAEDKVIQGLNRVLKGWAGYFRFGNHTHVFKKMEFYVRMKVGRWLWKRHGRKQRVEFATLADTHGLYQMI